MRSRERWTLFLIVLFSVAGISAGLFLIDGQSGGALPRFPANAMFGEAKDFIYSACSATVAGCLILFSSGFTSIPHLLAAPLFLYRGAALGHASRFVFDSPDAVPAVVSYAVITVLMAFLSYSAASFSTAENKRSPKDLLPFAYNYLLICGASIVVRVVPSLIVTEFINKI